MPFVMWRRRTRRRRRKWRATNTNTEGNNVLASRIPFKQSACAAAVMKCPSLFFPLHLSPSVSLVASFVALPLHIWCACWYVDALSKHLATIVGGAAKYATFFMQGIPCAPQVRVVAHSKSWEIEWQLYGVCSSRPQAHYFCSACTVALTVLSLAMQKKYISCFFHLNAQQNVRANYRSLLRILRDGWRWRTRARKAGMERKKGLLRRKMRVSA